jgi:Na+-transporting NADH:ubiquinone oxidoreductase subunit C
MARESLGKTFAMALTLCAVCSFLVSGAAVGLRSKQKENRDRDRKKNILVAAGLYNSNVPVDEAFRQVEPRIVDLETGDYVSDGQLDPQNYDQRLSAKDPELSVSIPSQEDLAGIRRREKYSFVYLVKKEGRLDQVVLPVNGKGLWSTMYGFLALDSDLNTVRGMTFYEHAETPGLGGEVDNPKWKALWPGKNVYDDQGSVQFKLIKGSVDQGSPEAIYQVDGLAGATLTANGVTHMVQYWLGDHGFKTFLKRLRSEGEAHG